MNTLLYLAYGSNLHPRWLQSRVPSARTLETVTLEGWKLLFNKHSRADGSAKCNIVHSADTKDRVYAAVYEFAGREKRSLDRAEGGYDCIDIELPGLGDAIIYLANSKHISDRIRPYHWYRDIVTAGADLHGFPEYYVTRLQNTPAVVDPDSNRDSHSRTIVWPVSN